MGFVQQQCSGQHACRAATAKAERYMANVPHVSRRQIIVPLVRLGFRSLCVCYRCKPGPLFVLVLGFLASANICSMVASWLSTAKQQWFLSTQYQRQSQSHQEQDSKTRDLSSTAVQGAHQCLLLVNKIVQKHAWMATASQCRAVTLCH